jgi:hypothetical protein
MQHEHRGKNALAVCKTLAFRVLYVLYLRSLLHLLVALN